MSLSPTIKEIELKATSMAGAAELDPIAVDELSAMVREFVHAANTTASRAVALAEEGFLPEAYSLIADFPDLVGQLHTLKSLRAENVPRSKILADCTPMDVSGLVGQRLTRLAVITEGYREAGMAWETLRTVALERGGFRSLRRNYLALLKKFYSQDNPALSGHVEQLEREWYSELQTRISENTLSEDHLRQHLKATGDSALTAPVSSQLREAIRSRTEPILQGEVNLQFEAIIREMQGALAREDCDAIDRCEASLVELSHKSKRMPLESMQAAASKCIDWARETRERARLAAAADHAEQALEKALDDATHIADLERAMSRAVEAAGAAGREPAKGLIRQAKTRVQADEDTRSRRHRWVLVGTVAGIAAVGALLFLIVTMYQKRQERDGVVEQLVAATEAFDMQGVGSLIASIEEQHSGELLPEESAAIQKARNRQAEVEKSTLVAKEDLKESEEAREAFQQSGKAIPERCVSALQHALESKGLDQELRNDLSRVLALLKADQAAHLASMRDKAGEAIPLRARFDKEWRPLDAWNDPDRTDLARLQRYIDAIESLVTDLERVESEIIDAADSRTVVNVMIGLAREQLKSAEEEYKHLQAVLASLQPDRLVQGVKTEEEFIKRMSGLADDRSGATLQRLGLLTGFDEIKRTHAECFKAIALWRDSYQAQLRALLANVRASTDMTPDQMQEVTDLLDQYEAAAPMSPMTGPLREFERDLRKQSGALGMSPGATRSDLAQFNVAGLRVVPMQGGTSFFRLGNPGKVDEFALQSEADLKKLPRNLSPMKVFISAPAAAADSPEGRIWADFFKSLEGSQDAWPLLEVSQAMSRFSEPVPGAADPSGAADPYFRIWSLRKLAEYTLTDSGWVISGQVKQDLEAWLNSLRSAQSGALHVLDWVKQRHRPLEKQTGEALSRAANELIKSFPVRDGRPLLRTGAPVDWAPPAYYPVGIVLHDAAMPSVRRVRLWDASSNDVFVVVPGDIACTLVPLKVTTDTVLAEGKGLGAGPALLFAAQRQTSSGAPRR